MPTRLADAVLIVINAQGEYLDGTLPLDGIGQALERMALLITRTRRAGGAVIHIERCGAPSRPFDSAASDSILARVAPVPGDLLIGKPSPNAFNDTDLGAQLAMLNRPPLILAGFTTHLDVSATARAALEQGYAVTVAADATATQPLPGPLGGPEISAAALQAAALAALADHFASITTVCSIPD